MHARIAAVVLVVVLALSAAGCGTIYKTAMDERSLSTQAADKTISATIIKRYLDDKDMSVLGIEPYTYNGQVYVVGEYESAAQKSKAVSIAQAVEGVSGVTAYLLPKKNDPACGASDSLGILGKVKAALVADKDIWSTNVEVKVVQCQVVLLGLVGSQAEVDKSIAHAKSVSGVRSVKSYLKAAKQG
jgi:hyperosmotically inducible protein